MKLHTKIFIGMTIGFLVGLVLNLSGIISETQVTSLEEDYQLNVKYIGILENQILKSSENIEPFGDKLAELKSDNQKIVNQYRLNVSTSKIEGDRLPLSPSIVEPVFQMMKLIGKVFISLLKLIILPLIMTSIITGITGIGTAKGLGKISLQTMIYYLTTTALSVTVGMLAVNIINPGGQGNPVVNRLLAAGYEREGRTLFDVFASIVPNNIVNAMASSNYLGVIFFAIFFGFVLLKFKDIASSVSSFIDQLNEIFLKMTGMVIKLTPYGVAAMLAIEIWNTGLQKIPSISLYIFTVLLALSIHALVTLPIVCQLFSKHSPLELFRGMRAALAMAFSSASSSATLPLTLKCARENTWIKKHVSGFVFPLGATVNMDGTALYESIVAIFIAQAYGIPLTIFEQLVIFITVNLTAIGVAGIPSASLVMLVIVLNSVGLPIEGIALILAVDRILDMCRTCINVWGDCVGASVVNRFTQ
ncbi:MAG: dicarboxylate/amino acid:cation symporter [candidate division Zixibacteria bacterium]|nr:dicarboxylate/amino acid:cation symporter [candidate division Zixibacteria bacterium]